MLLCVGWLLSFRFELGAQLGVLVDSQVVVRGFVGLSYIVALACVYIYIYLYIYVYTV